jgi:molecular chaperone Hsp33
MTALRTDLSIPADDVVLPFQITPFATRGRVVRLGGVVDSIVKRHNYPPLVARTLAEMIAMAAALAATLKYDGVFTLQTKGDGPIRMMLADVTSAGAVRGYAQYDSERLADLGDHPSVPKLFGAGYLAFTVDQGEHTERYQGIVELTGTTLAECAHHYFRQSEQFKAGLKVAAGAYKNGAGELVWRAGAIMVQSLPAEGAQGSAEGRDVSRALTEAQDEAEDGWRRALILMGSATSAELVDPALPPWKLVDRLFLAEGVEIYRPHDLRHACRCSRERVATVLRAFPRDEIEDLKVDGALVVTCEFCNTQHVFGEDDVAALYGGPARPEDQKS